MTIDKLSPTKVRAQTEKAGQALVEQKAITQGDLDALLKNPVLSEKERTEANKLVGAVRGRLETGAFGGAAGLAASLAAFERAVGVEVGVGERLGAAERARSIGAIDDVTFGKLTGPNVPLRAAFTVFNAGRAADAELERLKPIAAGAGADTKPALMKRMAAARDQCDALHALSAIFKKEGLAKATGLVAHAGGAVAAAATLALLLALPSGAHPDVVSEALHYTMVGAAAVLATGMTMSFIRGVIHQKIAHAPG